MSDEQKSMNIESVKKEIEEIRNLLELSDKEWEEKLIDEVRTLFRDKESVEQLRESYKNTVKQLEAAIMMLEGLGKMAESLGGEIDISESIRKALGRDFDTE